MTGSHRGTNVVAFDFASGIGTGGYGGAPTAVDASCAFTVLPASFPPLTILPRANQSHLGRWVVGRVRFERRFDRLFRIKTKDREFARLVLSEEMRELLLGPDGDARWLHPSEGGVVAFEIQERWIVCTAPLLEPPNIRRNLLEPLATFTENIRGAGSAELSGAERVTCRRWSTCAERCL